MMNRSYLAFSISQSGVALITVLLVIFLASITAVSLASLQQLSIRRSTVLQHQQQARLYVLGAEQWAIQILARDRAESDFDDLGEDWAQLPPALPVPGGQISGRIEDLQARFNLNNLEQLEGQVEADSADHFQRLLSTLNLPLSLADVAIDWIDSDQTLSPSRLDGAEDSDYLNYDPAYLAANRPLRSISEMRLLKGVDAEIYQQLSPYISALPEATLINVNTASAAVLTTLHEELDLNKAELLIQDRADQAFTDEDDFFQALEKLGIDANSSAEITTASDYFAVHAEARVGDARALLYSVLQRADDGRSQVILRSFTREN